MTAYYNEIDPYAAQWLRNLIAAGLIAPGDVDERSIVDVRASDLAGYAQCHFFAGIAGWSYALRLAGWPDERAVWTGSCPCQPLSSAGQRKGHADERHLWPAFHALIAECKPAIVFGEQVASKDGREWFAGVRADLEAVGYACGAADLCAASVGAPHIRQRLYWVANSEVSERRRADGATNAGRRIEEVGGPGASGGLADSTIPRSERAREHDGGSPPLFARSAERGEADRLAFTEHTERRALDFNRPDGRDGPNDGRSETYGESGARGEVRGLGDANGTRQQGRREQPENMPNQLAPWATSQPLACLDGKSRRVKSGLQCLAHGVPNRVGRLRAYGNAIVAPLAAEFIKAYCEI